MLHGLLKEKTFSRRNIRNTFEKYILPLSPDDSICPFSSRSRYLESWYPIKNTIRNNAALKMSTSNIVAENTYYLK